MKRFYFYLLALMFVLSGCKNLVHKEFQLVSHVKGGRITITDPAGSNTPLPQVMFGQFTNILTSVPIGGKLESTTTTYQFWSGEKSIEHTIKIDATGIPIQVLSVHENFLTGELKKTKELIE